MGRGGGLQELARLDTCVTVVDAAAFLDDLHAVESLRERAEAAARAGGAEAETIDPEDDRGVAELLMDQARAPQAPPRAAPAAPPLPRCNGAARSPGRA